MASRSLERRAPPRDALSVEDARAAALRTLDEVQRQLGRRTASERDVHDARKSLKRARALLRLLRPALAPRVFRRENVALRDAGRRLAGARDAKVLAAALRRLLERRTVERPAVRSLAHALEAECRTANDPAGSLGRALAESRALVRGARERLARAALRDDDASPLRTGMLTLYRRARTWRRRAERTPVPEVLHEFRKQVKNYWHAAEYLAPVWPRYFAAVARDAHRLSDRLGDDHDLALLDERTRAARLTQPATMSVRRAIATRRSELQDRAFALASRLFDARPRELARMLDHRTRPGASPR